MMQSKAPCSSSSVLVVVVLSSFRLRPPTVVTTKAGAGGGANKCITTTTTSPTSHVPMTVSKNKGKGDDFEFDSNSRRTQGKGDDFEFDSNSSVKRTRRRLLFVASLFLATSSEKAKAKTSKSKSPYDERRLLEQNRKIQEANNAPKDFPNFVRQGFEVQLVISDSYIKRDSGLIYLDIQLGQGDPPKDGQQVTFHYVGYNESGRRIDSTYLQGSPAKIRLGTNSLVPGFEEGIRDMRPGGKRRLIIPPELGPPVGPSTFFSSKQFEVFDVELLEVQNCIRRTIGFYSDVVCS